MTKESHSKPGQHGLGKVIAAFVAVTVSATIMGSVSVAGATSLPAKPSWDACKQAGYTNYGQCVKDWAHDKHGYGHGYGGDHKPHKGFKFSQWYKWWSHHMNKQHN